MDFKKKNKLIEQLSKLYNVTELQHAYRFNGIVDIFKHGEVVFDNVNKKYNRFNNVEDLEVFIIDFLTKNKPVNKFGNTGTKPTYKEFRARIEYANRSVISNAEKPEDMYWRTNIDNVIESDLYFLFHNGFVKIGRTRNMQRRIKQIKTSLSSEYECFVIMGKGNLEKKMHYVFSELSQNGEWFIEDIRMRLFISKRIDEKCAYKFIESNTKSDNKPKIEYHGEPKIKKNDGKLRMADKITFGKYKGKTFQEIAEIDFNYLLWIESNLKDYSKKFSEEFKRELIKMSSEQNKKAF